MSFAIDMQLSGECIGTFLDHTEEVIEPLNCAVKVLYFY